MSSEVQAPPGPAPRAEVPDPTVVVSLEGVTKVYDRAPRGARWRALVPGMAARPVDPHVALKSVDLELRRGESLGLIGPNGAGKSTILKLVAGVIHPTAGTVRCRGSVGSLIELGVGFHPELTGTENVRCSGALRDLDRDLVDAALVEIADFAELEGAMATPLKKYSMGMQARLAFALSTHFPVDVLAVDEVLAVGDTDFQRRCLLRIQALVDQGTALIFVSHEMRLLGQICGRTVHLSEGSVIDDGLSADVVGRYLKQQPPRGPDSAAPAMEIVRLEVPPTIDPWDHLEVEAEVVVHREVVQPAAGLDFTMPTLNPDLVHSLSWERQDILRQPGRYRLAGRTSPFAYEGIDLRVALTLSDGKQLLAMAESDCRIPGSGDSWSYLAMDHRWTCEQAVEVPSPPLPGQRSTPRSAADDQVVIDLANVTKTYRSGRSQASLRLLVPGSYGRWPGATLALDGLDLRVERGEAVGIIGPNGAGKSTALRLVAGLTKADSGSVRTRGQVMSMLDLASGMHPEMTGRENLRFNGLLTGFDHRELRTRTEEIIEYSGIGPAVDAPVRQYSSGMLARLGFAIAIHSPGDVILVDELLAVGDEEFRRRAAATLTERCHDGAALLFVSHELRLIEQVCSRAVHLDHGHVVADGPVTDIVDAYAGQQWAGGVRDATSGIRIPDLRARQRLIPIKGTFELSGTIAVDEPSASARLEVSYRATPPDREAELTRYERNRSSFFLKTLEQAGGALARPGTHRFSLTLGPNIVSGSFDVVLAVIDANDEEILAEAWQQVVVGHPNPNGMPGCVADVEWTIEEIPPGAAEGQP